MNFLDLSTDSVTLVFKVFATLILQEYVFLPMSNTSSWRRSSRCYVCPSYCALIPSKQSINLKVRLIACVLEHKTVIFFHWILFLDTNWNHMRREDLNWRMALSDRPVIISCPHHWLIEWLPLIAQFLGKYPGLYDVASWAWMILRAGLPIISVWVPASIMGRDKINLPSSNLPLGIMCITVTEIRLAWCYSLHLCLRQSLSH